jgi:D-alanyl-D-alanine dipeptidase
MELEMPNFFSELGKKCWAYTACNQKAHKNRYLLQTIITTNGFNIYEYKWWHFDLIKKHAQ